MKESNSVNEKWVQMGTIGTNIVIALIALTTLLYAAGGGVFRIGELNNKVTTLQNDVESLQADIGALEQKADANQKELLAAIESANQDISDKLTIHSHGEDGSVILRPVVSK